MKREIPSMQEINKISEDFAELVPSSVAICTSLYEVPTMNRYVYVIIVRKQEFGNFHSHVTDPSPRPWKIYGVCTGDWELPNL